MFLAAEAHRLAVFPQTRAAGCFSHLSSVQGEFAADILYVQTALAFAVGAGDAALVTLPSRAAVAQLDLGPDHGDA